MNDYSKIANDKLYVAQKQHYVHCYQSADLPIWSKNRPNPIIVSFIEEVLQQNPSPSVLDIGCGFGDYIDFLKDRTENILIGVDYVSTATQKAREKINMVTPNPKAHIEEIDFWDFQENGFDLIIDSGFFQHIKKAHWNVYIDKLKEHGNREFYFILSVFSENNRLYVNKTPKNNWAKYKGRYDYYFTEQIIRTAFYQFSFLRVTYANEGEKNETINFLLKYNV